MSNSANSNRIPPLAKVLLWVVGVVLALQILSGGSFLREVSDAIKSDNTQTFVPITDPTQSDTQNPAGPDAPDPTGSDTQDPTSPPQVSTPSKERYPSLPDELRNHVVLGARDQGISATLTGDVLITVVFVNDPTSTWTADRMAEMKAEDTAMLGEILADAAAYGINLKLTIDYRQGTASTTEESDRDAWSEQIMSSAGLGSVDTASRDLESAKGVKEAPILFYVDATDRSYAMPKTGTSTEYAIVWKGVADATTSRHELYHLFGAADFYMPSAVAACAERYFPDSVMLGGTKSQTDDYTAYLIGWTDALSDQALGFLRETAHITQEDASAEVEQETYTGYVENWKKHDGSIITGYLDFGILEGEGKVIEPNGGWQEGYFEYGTLVRGQCKYIYEDGSCYEGSVDHGEFHGQGTMVWSNGDSYTGQWKDGKYHGSGKLIQANGTWYEGTFAESNFISGQCKILYEDGSWYEGGMKNGSLNGQGTMVWVSGNRYTGQWKDGKYHGSGKLIGDNGSWYEGTFDESNFISGRCKILYEGGGWYEGDWAQGTINGQGTMVWASGDRYTGGFRNGKLHGYGTYTKSDGTVFAGNWEDSNFIG